MASVTVPKNGIIKNFLAEKVWSVNHICSEGDKEHSALISKIQ
jgi:hypothetical protein